MSSRNLTYFKSYEKQIKCPFVIYLQFESLQIPSNSKQPKIIHEPYGFAYSVKCSYINYERYEEYIGKDSPAVFWKKIKEEVTEIYKILNNSPAIPRCLNGEEKRIFRLLQKCYFCHGELLDDRHADFHPFTGDFLGGAHLNCKNQSKLPNTIPIVVHNLIKYALHFLRKELSQNEKNLKFNYGLVKNYEQFSIKIIDSKEFLKEKIEDLENILGDTKKNKLKKEFLELFNLVKKKIYFPFSHVDKIEKLQDSEFPKIESFFDKLHDEDISEENYKRCFDVWKGFNCQSLSDYFRVFLKLNLFLLEDIFENFRKLCLDKYGLDPVYYYTISGFSWDSMLKYTNVKLELLQDKTMIDFIRNNIRGGINHCSKRYSKANNIYCDDFDKSKPSTFIIYLDANNLGGWAMSQKLPFSDFAWMSDTEIQTLQKTNFDLDEDSNTGYICEVDLNYSQKLHKRHNDLPFCLEHLSFCEKDDSKKSVANLYSKQKYVIEYRALKQCLKNGLELKKIHRVLKYRQAKWLEPYITYNTKQRINAKNEFDLNLYKLLNNSVYGKTIQKKSEDKPIIAGFCILELSKKFMYDFHYEELLKKFPDARLLYIDTDGLIYEIPTCDYYEDIRNDKTFLDLLDTSNLNPCWGIPIQNKKIIGKMKEEYDGKIIREFFGVRSKVYFLNVDGEEVKKAAGVKKYVKVKYLSRDDYAECVLQNKKISRRYVSTFAKDDIVESELKTMFMLSPGDKKRVIMKDNINTLALGYVNKK